MDGPARRLFAGLCAGLLVTTVADASAQTARPHKRPQPPLASKPLDDANVTGDADLGATGAVARPPGSLQGASPSRPVLRPVAPPLPVLRSAVTSRWSRPASIAHAPVGQCRAVCAEQRLSCANGAGDTSGCDPGWTQCLSSCAGLSYSRGP